MSLSPGIIDRDELRENFDALTPTLSTQAQAGQKDFVIPLTHPILKETTPAAERSVDFTAPDDLEIRALRVSLTETSAGGVVTVTLTQADGDAAYLLNHTISVSATCVVGTVHATSDYRTTTGAVRLRLLRGVKYRLTAVMVGATGPQMSAALVLRSRRRRR